jgi:hypothetical protein
MLIGFLSAEVPSAAPPAAIAALVGSWGGSGRVTYTDGSSEGISCSAYYTGSDSELRMAIQCKSEKNPINIRSRLRIDGGRASGEWEERTFNASGTASGSIGASNISLKVSGGGFSGTMSVSFSRASHSVTITTQGIAMSKATMQMSRR